MRGVGTPSQDPLDILGSWGHPPAVPFINHKSACDTLNTAKTTMLKVAIRSGNISNTGKNFTGYSATGQRIHIPLRQMETLYPNFSKDTKVTFPLYALVVEREFDKVDADNQPTGVKFKRLQAGSIFANKAEMIESYNEDSLMELEAKAHLKAQAKAMDLDENAINALLSLA